MKEEKVTNQRGYKILSVILLCIGASLLMLAQSAYWVNHNFFNKQYFTETTKTVLTSESSKNAIATTVVNRALIDKPLIRRVAGDRAISLISGLIGTDIASQSISWAVNSSYNYMTTQNRKDITIDLTSIKNPLSGVVSFAENRGNEIKFDPSNIPNEVVLIRSNDFPDLSGTISTLLWLSPLLWLGSLVSFAIYVYIGRKEYVKKLYNVGFSIIGVSLLGLFIGPFLPPAIASMANNSEIRVIIQDLTTEFLKPFHMQMYIMIIITSLALIVFSQRLRILGLVKKIEKKP